MLMLSNGLTTQRSNLESAFSTPDLTLLDSLLTDHVVWSTPSQSPWLGRHQVLERIAEFFEHHRYVLRYVFSQVDSNGTRAVDRTNYESWVDTTPVAGGEPHRGSAIIVWTREDDWSIEAYLDVGAVLFGPDQPSR